MPKAYSIKNINKLKVYLSKQNGGTTTNIKPNGKADKGYSDKP